MATIEARGLRKAYGSSVEELISALQIVARSGRAGGAPRDNTATAVVKNAAIKQLMATFDHWKQYLALVESPCNGMTFDCGVTRELGEDPVSVCRYLGDPTSASRY